MRQKRSVVVLVALSLIMFMAAGTGALAGGEGCSKSAAKAAKTADASAGTGCSKTAAQTASAEGKPCCTKMAVEQALLALKTAANDSGCGTAAAAVEAAQVAVKQAEQTTGCSKSKAAAQEAAMVALQEAAEATRLPSMPSWSPKTKRP
jgi:hypothetical protein